jgi:hypothetical protein
MWPRNTGMEVSFVIHANCVRTRRITLQQEPFTVTCSTTVSCPTTVFGPSMEKEGLFWRMVNKKMILFLTLSIVIMMSFLKILQWVSLKKMLKDTLQKMILVRCCAKWRKFAKQKRNPEI